MCDRRGVSPILLGPPAWLVTDLLDAGVKRRFEDFWQEWGRRGCRQSAGALISGESRGWEFTVCEFADHEALGLCVLGHSLPPLPSPLSVMQYPGVNGADCQNGGCMSAFE